MGQLDGKVVLVTGGASGIGEATVVASLREGARVIAVDMNREKLDALAQQYAGNDNLAVEAADLSAASALAKRPRLLQSTSVPSPCW